MKPLHPKYKVKPGDTVESITRLFGVSEDQWKNYHHNIFWTLIPWDTLPEDLEYIFLLPELWEREEELNNAPTPENVDFLAIPSRVHLGYENFFAFKIQKTILNYGVSIAIMNGDEETTLKYSISTYWMMGGESKKVEISLLSPVTINNTLPDCTLESLATDAFKIIYPITLVLDYHGECTDIADFTDIQQRWEQNKESLRKRRQGKIVDKYISLMDYALSRQDFFFTKIRSHYFFFTFFPGIYQPYSSGYSVDRSIRIPFYQAMKGVKYDICQRIEPTTNEYGRVVITATGKVSDERSVQDIEFRQDNPVMESSEKLEGEYYARYFVDPDTHLVETMRTECTLNTNPEKKITVKVSVLN